LDSISDFGSITDLGSTADFESASGIHLDFALGLAKLYIVNLDHKDYIQIRKRHYGQFLLTVSVIYNLVLQKKKKLHMGRIPKRMLAAALDTKEFADELGANLELNIREESTFSSLLCIFFSKLAPSLTHTPQLEQCFNCITSVTIPINIYHQQS
jgi:hypothetical protein